jgi:hypothetical protein
MASATPVGDLDITPGAEGQARIVSSHGARGLSVAVDRGDATEPPDRSGWARLATHP